MCSKPQNLHLLKTFTRLGEPFATLTRTRMDLSRIMKHWITWKFSQCQELQPYHHGTLKFILTNLTLEVTLKQNEGHIYHGSVLW